MSSQQRKTVDMGEGAPSTSKSTRMSRIAQPIRRPSTRGQSLERPPSLDRLTVCGPGSAIKTRKGTTYTTPMRTPNKQSQRPEPILTCEKDKIPTEKRVIQMQASKITDYLNSTGLELGGDFARVGLKGMTAKQFIVILSHLLHFVVGNRMRIGENYVDTVVKILGHIGYPYPVNKSWLKTPTAPHAFNNVVVMLHWLMQFIPNKDAFAELTELIVPSADFPDKKFAQLFMRRAEEGFVLWNNGKDEELKALKENLVDELIAARTGIKGAHAIAKETSMLNDELDKLFQKRVVIEREDEFLKLDKEVKDKEKLVLRMEESCSSSRKKLKELTERAECKCKELSDIHKRIAMMKETIRAQEISVERREELISQISYLRSCVESRKTLINQLQDMGANNQILLSRLMKQKVDGIAKFNKYLYQIFSEPRESCSIDVKDYLLDQNSENLEEQLNRVLPLLQETTKRNLEEHVKYSNEISELESQLKLAKYTHDTVLEKKLSDLKQRCSDLEKDIEEVNIQMIQEKWHGETQMEEMTTCLKEVYKDIAEIKEYIRAQEDKFSKMQTENKAMLARIEEKGNEVITGKAKQVDRLCEAIDSFSSTMEDITLELKDYL